MDGNGAKDPLGDRQLGFTAGLRRKLSAGRNYRGMDMIAYGQLGATGKYSISSTVPPITPTYLSNMIDDSLAWHGSDGFSGPR